MVATRNGVDIICVNNREEASCILKRLFDETSLSRKEISETVGFSDLSVADVVRCYNEFFKADERKVMQYAEAFRRAA
jgi:hypothetical protein